MHTLATQLEELVIGVATSAGPSTVTVGRGSGVVIAPGQILTNAHNVHDGATPVVFPDGRRTTGEPLGVDVEGDLAVVAADTGESPAPEWADQPPPLGRVVVALARPFRRGLTATVGTVAVADARFRGPSRRPITGAFEHSARMPRGASGGPVFDGAGRLVGINTHRRRDGFYAAVATTAELRDRVERLTRGEVPTRPRLGVALAPPHVARRLRAAVGLDAHDGLLVREVEPDTPAERAGLQRGDLLVRASGRELTSPDELAAAIDAGDGVLVLELVRGNDTTTVEVDLT